MHFHIMTIVGIFTFFFMKRLNEFIFECFYYRFNDCIMYMWIWWQIIAFIIMKHLSSFNLYGNRFYMLIYIIFWNTMIPYQVGKLCCSHDLRFCSNLSPFVSKSSNSNKPQNDEDMRYGCKYYLCWFSFRTFPQGEDFGQDNTP